MAELLVVAVALFVFAMFSARSATSPVTAPMVFTSVGLLVGTAGVGVVDLSLDSEAVSVLVEATLLLVLFADAVRIDLRVLRHSPGFPLRLLAIGLPLTIAAGTLAGWLLFPGLLLAEAALLAAVLAPTDAALGQAVVSDRRLPARIRQGLNVESGLNDGIVVPVVTVLIVVAAAETTQTDFDVWGELVARQVGFGLLLGAAIGTGGGWLLNRRALAGRVEGAYRQLATIAVAVAAFAASELVEGNGFIAAFVGGLCFGQVAREHCHGIQDFTEDEGELLTAITFLVFGAVLVGPRLDALSWPVALYVLLSLTAVRMLPVLVAMTGSGTLLETRLFAGWFGPRGLASILFALVVFEDLETDGVTTILDVAMWTVLASVFLHGLTANAWTGRLAARLEDAEADRAEMADVPELPTRRRLSGPRR